MTTYTSETRERKREREILSVSSTTIVTVCSLFQPNTLKYPEKTKKLRGKEKWRERKKNVKKNGAKDNQRRSRKKTWVDKVSTPQTGASNVVTLERKQ